MRTAADINDDDERSSRGKEERGNHREATFKEDSEASYTSTEVSKSCDEIESRVRLLCVILYLICPSRFP